MIGLYLVLLFMNYDHNCSEQPELLAVGQRSGRTELLSRADLEKKQGHWHLLHQWSKVKVERTLR